MGEQADSDWGLTVPRRLAATTVELSSTELMILSLIDERASVQDIAEMLGAEPAQLRDAFARLVELQVIDLGAAPTPQRPQGTLEPARAELADVTTTRKKLEAAPAVASEPEQVLEEVVDLPPEFQAEIEQVAERVFSSDPFVVLGCTPETPRDEIRQVYHAGIRRFHPDRYFGKELGSYKAKLERIFRRLTTAYEVLEASMAPPPRTSVPAPGADTAAESIPQAPRAASFSTSEPQRRQSSSSSLRSAGQSSGRIPAAGSDSEARRRALARKLSVGSMRRVSVPPQGSAESVADAQARSRDSLRRMHADRSSDPRQRIERYLQTAKEAELEHDLISARNAVKIAASMDPDNAELAKRLEQLEQAVAVKHADEYIQRGQVAERQEQWGEAALMYERASRGRPHNTLLLERAANCLLTEKKDLGHALRLAKAAVLQAPQRASHRVVLARVYLAADMRKSAEGEFDRAKGLDAHDPQVRALGKELGRR